MKYLMDSEPTWTDRFTRRLTADGDAAPGGGSPAADTAGAPAAGVVAAAPAAAAPDAGSVKEPTSLLSDAKPEGDAGAVKEPVLAETPEQKAERLKNETPEQKTARETEEAKVRTEALKPYDGLKLPEGMPADQPAFVDFKNAALDLGVEPEKAQKLIDTVAPKMKEAMEAPYNLWAETQVEWVNAIKSDPEIGGADMEKNFAKAALAIDKIGGAQAPELRKALAFTGAGNNPEIARMLVRMGKMLAEGSPILGKPAAPAQPNIAQKVYPNMQPTP